MIQKLLRYLIPVVGYLLMAYTLVYFVREGTKIYLWRTSGNVNSQIEITKDSLFYLTSIDSADFAGSSIPMKGDTLISIKDSAVTPTRLHEYFVLSRPIGEEIPIVFSHAGQHVSTIVKLRETTRWELVQYTTLELLRFLIAISFVGVGLWAYRKRSDSAGVRALALYCMSMTAFSIVDITVMGGKSFLFDIPFDKYVEILPQILVPCIGAFWLNLQLLFPRPKKIMLNRPWLAYVLCYLPPTVILVVSRIPQLSAGIKQVYIGFVLAAIGLQILGGLAILFQGYRRTTDMLEKRQTRLVLGGSGVGILTVVALVIFAAVYPNWVNVVNPVLVICLVFATLLVSPITFAYAFGKYRLLEIEGRIKRGTQYVALTVVLLLVFVLLVYYVGQFLLDTIGISGSLPSFAIAMLLAILFVTSQRKIREYLERKFYPGRYRLRGVIREFSQRMLSMADRSTFWGLLENELRLELAVESVCPILKSQDDIFRYRDEAGAPFSPDKGLLHCFAQDRQPLLLDEAIASGCTDVTLAEADWLQKRRVALMLPLISHNQLIGILGLGFKQEQDDYSPEELQILSSLASQVAMTSENLRLIEENVDKQRMQEELQVARKIQEGFLPQTMPATTGLRVAARNKFCLEVAGDYYDVIHHASGETVLAVGDVSGKGAGAALIMANLQASLRTAAGFGIKLSDIVARINDLIHHNTPPEQYITFFAAIYNSARKELTYVNAGHNPPMLFKSDGSHRLLSVGGIILGSIPGMPYQQETVAMESGDMVLLYTDGVSEAMNAVEEEYGEDRMLQFVQTHRQLAPTSMLSELETDVVRFHGQEVFEDDFTLLLAVVE